MAEITGAWINRGLNRIAVQLDEDTIVITNYSHDPASTHNVTHLDDGWDPLPVDVDGLMDWHA